VWNWFKRKRQPKPPTFSQVAIGELHVPSGKVQIADPMFLGPFDSTYGVVVEVPVSKIAVQALLIRYPEGGQRIARIGLFFGEPPPDSRQRLGEVGVDSATVVLVDPAAVAQYWKNVGPERLGWVGIPGGERLARLIARRFALTPRFNGLNWEFEDPISESLEEQIREYLKTVPGYDGFAYVFFHVKTWNTHDQIREAMSGRGWCEFVLDEASGASLFALPSGFGDGTYQVEGLYRSGQLIGVEVEFIGPDQDEILEAFPVLRY
jgi:hypothetical protein